MTSTFDLETYISRYPLTSETHLQRLLFLAHHFHNHPPSDDAADNISATAFQMAVSQMKSSGNHRRYTDEFAEGESSSATSPSACPESSSVPTTPNRARSNSHGEQSRIIHHYQKYDSQFVAESKSSMAAQLEVLEGRLGTAQNHINKEAIRNALLALGEFLRVRGELREGWRRAVRSRYVHS